MDIILIKSASLQLFYIELRLCKLALVTLIVMDQRQNPVERSKISGNTDLRVDYLLLRTKSTQYFDLVSCPQMPTTQVHCVVCPQQMKL